MRPEMRRDFVESGTVHVFAISGLHVMVIANIFMLLAAFAAVPLRFRALIALPLLWGYVWMLGFPPSAVRAVLMASIHYAAPIFWRRGNAVVAWSAAFMIMHVFSPELITDVGCRLSFAVMLAIVLATRQVRDLQPLRQRLTVAFSAWAAGVPIVAHVFGTLTPGGLVANLALVPAATLAVVACVVGVAFSWIGETFCAYANNFAALVTSVMAGISCTVARLPGANLEIGTWGIVECVLWYLALLAIPFAFRLAGARRLF
jgi:competence protein ComEC